MACATFVAWPQIAHATSWAVVVADGEDGDFGPEAYAVGRALTEIGWNVQVLDGNYFNANVGDPNFMTGTAAQYPYLSPPGTPISGLGMQPEILWALRDVQSGDSVFLDIQGHGSDAVTTLRDSNGVSYSGPWLFDDDALLQQTVPYPFDYYLTTGAAPVGLNPPVSAGAPAFDFFENWYGSHWINTNMTVNGLTDLSNIGTGDFSFGLTLSDTQPGTVAVANQRSVCGHGTFWDLRMLNGGLILETDDGFHYTALNSTATVNDGSTHTIIVSRVSGTLRIAVDGAVTASGSSEAAFSALSALQTSTDVCVGRDATASFNGSLYGGTVRAPNAPGNLTGAGIQGIVHWVRSRGASVAVMDHSCLAGATARELEDFGDPHVCAISTTGIMGPGLTGFPAISSFIANSPWTNVQGATMDDLAKYVSQSYNAGAHTTGSRVESAGFRSGCNQTMAMRDTLYLSEEANDPFWGWNQTRPSLVLRRPALYINGSITIAAVPSDPSLGIGRYWNTMFSQAITHFYVDNDVTQDPLGLVAWTYHDQSVQITATLDRLDADLLSNPHFGYSPSAGWMTLDAYLRAAFIGCSNSAAPVSFPSGYNQTLVCANPTPFITMLLGWIPLNPSLGVSALDDYNTITAWDSSGETAKAQPLENELEAFENTCSSPACSSIVLLPNQEARWDER